MVDVGHRGAIVLVFGGILANCMHVEVSSGPSSVSVHGLILLCSEVHEVVLREFSYAIIRARAFDL